MKEEKLLKFEIDEAVGEEHATPFCVEYNLLTSTDYNELKSENLKAIEEIDSRIEEIEKKVEKLNSEIDTLTNHADGIDYVSAAICGIITGIIDSVFIGKWDFAKAKADANEKINNEVIKFAKNNPNYIAWCDKNGKDSNRLVSAIGFLEKTYTLPGDGEYKDFKGLGINDSTHHLDDFCHHPTLAGLLCSIITQFSGDTKYYSSKGNVVKVPVTVNDYGNFVSEDKWGKVFAGIVNWFFKAAKTIQNQKGHLKSDVAGSLSSANKGNIGSGLPGSFISILKEFSSLPCFYDEEFSENLRKAYQNGIGTNSGVDLKAFNAFFEGASSKFDLRTEMAVKSELKRQAIPVVLNEILVRGVYFIRRFIDEMKSKKSISEISWKNVIPIGNRTIVRMVTIATGTFTAFDVADAAIRSGGFKPECILRINIVGVGRFAIAIVTDTAMGIKKNIKTAEVIAYQGIEVKLLNAKVYYGLSNEWICAKEATEAIIQARASCENMLMQEKILLQRTKEYSNDIKEDAEAIYENDAELAAEMLRNLGNKNTKEDKKMNDTTFKNEDFTKIHETMNNNFDRIAEIEKKIVEAKQRADDAIYSSEHMREKWYNLASSRIKDTQEAVKSNSKAIYSSNEAMGLMFEHIKELANIADSISNLGASSIAANTAVLDELRTYLSGSKSGNLGDFARKKLLELTKKLALYRSSMEIQEENTEQIAKINRWMDTVDDQISDIKDRYDEIDSRIDEIYNRIDEIDIQVSDNTKHLERHDAEIEHLQEKVNQRHKSLELADAVIDKVQQVDVKKTGSKAFGYVLLVLGGYFLFCVVLGLFALTISGTFATMETAEMIGTIVFLAVIGVISFFVFWKGRKRIKRK